MSISADQVYLAFTEITEHGLMQMYVRADTILAFAAVPDGGARLHIVLDGIHLAPVVKQSPAEVGERIVKAIQGPASE